MRPADQIGLIKSLKMPQRTSYRDNYMHNYNAFQRPIPQITQPQSKLLSLTNSIDYTSSYREQYRPIELNYINRRAVSQLSSN